MINKTKWFERSFPSIADNGLLPGIIERLEGTSARLYRKIGTHTAFYARSEAGRWGIHKQIGHLLDLEGLWLTRARQIAAGEKNLQVTDLNNTRTHEAGHDERPAHELARQFEAVRGELVAFLRGLEPAALENAALHPRLGTPMRIVDLAFFVAEHDDHHLADITALLAQEGVDQPAPAPAFTGPRYVLAVKNLERSARFYEEKLGFTTEWKVDGWQKLFRDRFVVMLGECADDAEAFETRNHSYYGYLDVQNVDALHAELAAKGVTIMYPLRSQPWGQREFGIQTIDGHRIMFGESLEAK